MHSQSIIVKPWLFKRSQTRSSQSAPYLSMSRFPSSASVIVLSSINLICSRHQSSFPKVLHTASHQEHSSSDDSKGLFVVPNSLLRTRSWRALDLSWSDGLSDDLGKSDLPRSRSSIGVFRRGMSGILSRRPSFFFNTISPLLL